jgi:hypothetical protein
VKKLNNDLAQYKFHSKKEFKVKDSVSLFAKDVSHGELGKVLRRIIGSFIKSNFKESKYYKFRIYTHGLRVRDFNFFNMEMVEDADFIEFRTIKGEPKNWQKFSSKCDVYIDVDKRVKGKRINGGMIHINVKGEVLNGYGEERYLWDDEKYEIVDGSGDNQHE